VHHVVDRRGGRRDAGGQHLGAEQGVHEGGLAVVELAEHHQVEAALAQLGQARVDEIGAQRLEADLAGQRGQLVERRHHAVPGFLVIFQHGYHTARMSATLASVSAASRPPAMSTALLPSARW
jgi:hypothetical protein